MSGVRTIRHGGNTSCIEIRHLEEIIICDAGSGIRELGLLLARGRPRRLDIFITHTHWDHIAGFPFFAPAYIPGFELHVYGARGFKKDLRSVFTGQLDSDYFPVQFEDMKANIEFHVLEEPALRLGGFEISWEFTHHPAATYAYKIKFGRRSMAYVSDNEFLHGYLGPPQDLQLSSEVAAPYRPLVEFLDGVDLLIGEAQYTNEEYRSKIGWGHSSLSNACVLAQLANVKRWIVTHHDPLHDDDFLDQKLNTTKEVARVIGHPMEVRHGYDGLVEFW
ncbi:MAG: MBL fold metallo-hydrolase [Verrucomicrobia bacterium]|nr:MBL fold metallo-hydrolase [Verrucomicrobiota bacterium]